MLDLTQKKPYIPTDEESAFILRAYTDYLYDHRLKNQPLRILNGRTLQEFWDESERDYNVIIDDSSLDDPVTPYASSISRDKANIFISTLTQQMLYPSVAAQNEHNEIDQIMSRVSRSLLEWQTNNDGKPAESGLQKNSRYIHSMVVTGTVHVEDNIGPEGELISSLVPNEEIFFPNLYQPNIQLQSHVLRMQNAIDYGSAEIEFGELQRFNDYVVPMSSATFMLYNQPEFRQLNDAINPKDAMHIMRTYYPVPYKKLKEYIASGRLPKYCKKAKYYNVIINGVLMFPVDNLLPYHHGNYNISKGIFENFSNPMFYFGNSMPNKARHDKKWLDGWKQLIRYRAKLSALPPIITFNGSFIDSDITIPGMITQAPSGMSKDDIQTVPGLTAGISNADLAIMRDGESDIDRSTTSASSGGSTPNDRATARGRLIDEANSQKLLQGFGMQIGYLVEARTYPILSMSYQFLPRGLVKKIAIPDQGLPGGESGTMEVIFMEPTEVTDAEKEAIELSIFNEENKARKNGSNKKITYINYEYARNLGWYVKAVPDQLIKETKALREGRAEMKFNTYVSHPELFNTKAAAKQLAKEYGDDPAEMVSDSQPITPTVDASVQGIGSGGGQNPISKMMQQSAARVTDNSAALPTY